MIFTVGGICICTDACLLMLRTANERPLIILVADCNGVLWWWIGLGHHATPAENGKLLCSNTSTASTDLYGSWIDFLCCMHLMLYCWQDIARLRE